MTTTLATVGFVLTTDARQDEGAFRRSLRRKLDELADSFAGEVIAGTVNIVVDKVDALPKERE